MLAQQRLLHILHADEKEEREFYTKFIKCELQKDEGYLKTRINQDNGAWRYVQPESKQLDEMLLDDVQVTGGRLQRTTSGADLGYELEPEPEPEPEPELEPEVDHKLEALISKVVNTPALINKLRKEEDA